ncbi:protein quiver [Venturia canescens]|uniref:protein quiver n=1 Tax=Venturia canescens TaxID=32260 RepID=UPI001C9D2DBA|nr:protein quiver [Venturia canescens]
MGLPGRTSFLVVATLLCSIIGCEAIRCYQCGSDQDPKGKDLCGAYKKYDTDKNSPVECSSLDSVTPGTFCVKLTRQSPRGFIWDGRWRQVQRSCASVARKSITGVCNWGVEENGVFWEECTCSEDGCNSASSLYSTTTIFLITVAVWYAIFTHP